MKHSFDGFNWLVRLEKGELLIECLTRFVREQKIGGAWVSGLGAASWAEVGLYDLKAKSYKWQKLDRLLEINSLQGNIAWDNNEPVLHLHGSFSDDSMKAFGGHIKELEVAGTCEILLHRWYLDKLNRSEDPATGLKLLEL